MSDRGFRQTTVLPRMSVFIAVSFIPPLSNKALILVVFVSFAAYRLIPIWAKSLSEIPLATPVVLLQNFIACHLTHLPSLFSSMTFRCKFSSYQRFLYPIISALPFCATNVGFYSTPDAFLSRPPTSFMHSSSQPRIWTHHSCTG